MATTVTCPHGLDRDGCLICATLGITPTTTPAPARPAQTADKTRTRAGADTDRRHRPRLGVLGWLVVVAAVAFGAWFLVHLVWTFLHLVELALVGVVCGAVGYRVGVVVGRHRR
jgi:hypothetical protein